MGILKVKDYITIQFTALDVLPNGFIRTAIRIKDKKAFTAGKTLCKYQYEEKENSFFIGSHIKEFKNDYKHIVIYLSRMNRTTRTATREEFEIEINQLDTWMRDREWLLVE